MILCLSVVRWVTARELASVGFFPGLFFLRYTCTCEVAPAMCKQLFFLTLACTDYFNNNTNYIF